MKLGNGTGNTATDAYRENKGLAAANVLAAGHSIKCFSADHSGGSELCVEVLTRLSKDNSKCASDDKLMNSVHKAIDQLRAGYGYNANQASHSGGNTCAEVIAKATN